MDWQENLIRTWEWEEPIDNREEKERVVQQVVGQAQDGQVIGVGSGSTVYLALLALARRIRCENLHLKVIPASMESAMICTRLGIPQASLWEQRPDWTMDGADEVDQAHNLMKGRGGAMFREKLLIRSSRKVFIMVDSSKLVRRLGERFPVPVEILPEALPYVQQQIQALGASRFALRPARGKDGPVITESGNFILDVWFDIIPLPLEAEMKAITGVIETGLFIGYPVEVLVAGR